MKTMKITIAVALYTDEDGKLQAYAEGWNPIGERGRAAVQSSCEETLAEVHGFVPIAWRFIEADVPVPDLSTLDVEGVVTSGDGDLPDGSPRCEAGGRCTPSDGICKHCGAELVKGPGEGCWFTWDFDQHEVPICQAHDGPCPPPERP
jgi:hypothetical protein